MKIGRLLKIRKFPHISLNMGDLFVIFGKNLRHDPLSSYHGEHHLEASTCIDGVGMVGGHDEHFACLGVVGLSVDDDFCLAVYHGNDGIERSRVF